MKLNDTELDSLFSRFLDAKGINVSFTLSDLDFDVFRVASNDGGHLVGAKRAGFTPDRHEHGTIPWFKQGDLTTIKSHRITDPLTSERTTPELVKAKLDPNGSGRSEKLEPIRRGDVLVSFKLTLGVAKVYDCDAPAYCNEAIDIIRCSPDFYADWVALNCRAEYPKHAEQQQLGKNLNEEHKKLVRIFKPRPCDGLTSVDLQRLLSTFALWYLQQLSSVRDYSVGIANHCRELLSKSLLAFHSDEGREALQPQFERWLLDESRMSPALNAIAFEDVPVFALNPEEAWFTTLSAKLNAKQASLPLTAIGLPVYTGAASSIGKLPRDFNPAKVISASPSAPVVSYATNGQYAGGNVVLHTEDFYINNDRAALLPTAGHSAKYLYYLFQSIREKYQLNWGNKAAGHRLAEQVRMPRPVDATAQIQTFIDFFEHLTANCEGTATHAEKVMSVTDELGAAFLNKLFDPTDAK